MGDLHMAQDDTEHQAIWRAMRAADLPEVMAVADAVHLGLPEDQAVFAERMALYPEGCLVLQMPDGEIAGYAISHPIVAGQPPQLNSFLGEIGAEAGEYYIHDVALLPKLRGSGLAKVAILKLLQQARGFDRVALVSVYGTADFWGRFGFAKSPRDMSAKLAAYGADAVYMTREA